MEHIHMRGELQQPVRFQEAVDICAWTTYMRSPQQGLLGVSWSCQGHSGTEATFTPCDGYICRRRMTQDTLMSHDPYS